VRGRRVSRSRSLLASASQAVSANPDGVRLQGLSSFLSRRPVAITHPGEPFDSTCFL